MILLLQLLVLLSKLTKLVHDFPDSLLCGLPHVNNVSKIDVDYD